MRYWNLPAGPWVKLNAFSLIVPDIDLFIEMHVVKRKPQPH